MKEPKTFTPEAVFHRAIKMHLNKRQQGYVMGAFREAAESLVQPLQQEARLDKSEIESLKRIIERFNRLGQKVEARSCSCVDKCAQGDLATDEVTMDCKRSSFGGEV